MTVLGLLFAFFVITFEVYFVYTTSKMEDLEKLMEIGEKLGHKGRELQAYVQGEIARIEKKVQADIEREERLKDRERTREKEQEEFQKEKLEKELKAQENELEILRIKAKMAEETPAGPPPAPSSSGTSLKMPAFEENRDNLDAYLERFERFALGEKWKKADWAIRLGALLKGRSLDIFSKLPKEDALDYEKLKVALLKMYAMTEEGYRTRFRTCRPEKYETPTQFIDRIGSYLDNWVTMAKIEQTYKGLRDLFLREQFLRCVSSQMMLFIQERENKDIDDVCAVAERYVKAHGLQSFTSPPRKITYGPNKFEGKSYPKSTPNSSASSKQPDKQSAPGSSKGKSSSGTVICYNCERPGHRSFQCTEPKKRRSYSQAQGMQLEDQKKAIAEAVQTGIKEAMKTSGRSEAHACFPVNLQQNMENAVQNETKGESPEVLNMSCNSSVGEPVSHPPGMPTCKGLVSGTEVSVLRDTGCSSAVVRSELVSKEQLTGKTQRCILIDGTKREFPLAVVHVDTPFFTGKVEALCMDNPVYDLIIGNLVGAREPKDPDSEWIPSKMTPSEVGGAAVTRAMAKKKDKPPKPLHVSSPIADVSRSDFIKAQKDDPTLTPLWERTDQEQDGKYKYATKNEVLVRLQEDKDTKGKYHSRVVVPKPYRSEVCRVAHECIMAGHQAKSRTYDKVASQFFWPGMYKDVSDYCTTCDICQKTVVKGRMTKVPLGKVPLVEEPFKRIAMDLVGPIYPASERGRRFILTIMDYATRYPEAVALSNIDAETVAEALLEVYSRIGIPSEVLTDMGTQFTSSVMREVSRLLAIKQLTTTPYNPKCNGMVERFNATLKTMLKRMCAEQPRDWDRYLAPLLFAYREAPHESLGGFSPFEMLYGRRVRGPMQVLKELLTKEGTDMEVKSTYQYIMDLRERLEDTCTLAHDMLAKATAKYKAYYDKKAKPRSLKEGDQVLVLLPTDHNKLLLQWKGPFVVQQRFNDCDYKVQMKDKIKTFHINLLKKYLPRTSGTDEASMGIFELPIMPSAEYSEQPIEGKPIQQELACTLQDETPGEFQNEDDINDGKYIEPMPCVTRKQGPEHVQICSELSSQQRAELEQLIDRYEDIFTDVPKKTHVIECDLQLTTNVPIRSKPYPVPHALRETIQKEVDDMLSLGIIEKSNSPYASPVVMVRKKDNTVRFCVDFRKLNRIVMFDPEPMPNPEDLFTKLSKGKYLSKLDMTKGYWQIAMSERSKDMTAFVTPDAQYRFLYLPFGLVVAPALFTRMMRKLFGQLENVVSYIDDLCVWTETWSEHLSVLEKVFQILREANLAAKPSKCSFGYRDIGFLGHHVGHGYLQADPELLDKIQRCERPTTKKEVRSYLGLTGFYRVYIPRYAEIAVPLTDLTRKGQSNKVKWEEAHERAFQTLKCLLVKPPILRLPDFSKMFVLRTDASDKGVAGILMQEFESMLHPIAYASRKLLPREQNYSVIEREALAIIWAIGKFDLYLFGRPFIIQTDHKPLTYIDQTKCLNKRIMRWAILLQEYKFKVEAVAGKANCGADFLSRVPVL